MDRSDARAAYLVMALLFAVAALLMTVRIHADDVAGASAADAAGGVHAAVHTLGQSSGD